MQALYAHFQSDDNQLNVSEKNLVSAIQSIYDLYIYFLSAVLEVSDFARNRMEDARQKFLPTEEEKNPNTRFIDNKFLLQLDTNRDLRRNIERLKISWADDQEMFRRIFLQMRDSEAFARYMSAETATYKDDKEIVVYLLGELMLGNDTFLSLFEEKNINWVDDVDTAAMMFAKTIKKWDAKMDEFQPLPPLIVTPDEEGDDLIRDFVIRLFRKTIFNSEKYAALIAARAQNWELERIAVLDVILIKMAITEFTEFPSIPLKVTINEYIEISKEYSTPRSRQFINGILDKLVNDLKAEGLIKKSGRGLLE
ncbi:MAG: transcription antitermination protein NusB [Lentimicrobiaceae bacterium]|nr:transcription antitermination protein NusB [Lentimicrobiaceae bacterium]MCO5266259.1 transcription antitermination protein NusB [Lentimicrobium sp.]